MNANLSTIAAAFLFVREEIAMNTIKQIYCRTFQTAFRVALPVLPYRNPKILNQVTELPDLLDKIGAKHPLIVTDSVLRSLGITQKLETALCKANITFSIYDKTEQNPTTQMVEEALTVYHNSKCDCLIAFGGGSPMDCAKAVGARLSRPEKSLAEMAGILKVRKKTPTIIAIPTTAGTGSETTLAAVIVDANTHHKYVINDFALIPDYAVLDSALIHSLPPLIAAATGMDALTHAVEAYIGCSTTKETRSDAIEAVKLIFENIEDAVINKTPLSEENMLKASHLAGRAFTRSYVGYVHAVSHSLSGQYNMPHGLTNAILLPIVLEMYGPTVYKKLSKLALAVNLGNKEESEKVLAERFIQSIYSLNSKLGIPSSIDGIHKQDIDKLASYADKEANPLYPVPVLWNTEELKEIYRKAAIIHEC